MLSGSNRGIYFMNKKMIVGALIPVLLMGNTFAYSATIDLDKNIAQINSSIEKANYRGADDVVYKTLQQYKDNREVQALAAVSWALQGKLELAQDQIDKLKNIVPKNSNLHFAQGVVFYKRITSSNMAFRTKTESLFDIAEREFRYAIQLDSNNYKAYNALGVVELKKGNVEEARKNIEKALELCPNYAIAVDNLGTVCLAEEDVSKAEHYFKKAIEINPNSSSAYYHLAQLECERGNYSKCLTYLDKCLAWKGYSSYAYNLRGDAFRLQGNEAAAIAAYKKAIEITPENLAPYANLAAIYEGRKDFELALDAYKTILSINPNSEQTLLKLADMYLETGKYDDAIALYYKLNNNLRTEGIKGLASAYYGMAMDSANKANFSSDTKLLEAYNYLEKAIQMNPGDLELYLAKAKISSLINLPDQSVQSLNVILSKPVYTIDDLLLKGDAYSALGDYKSAEEQYNRAILNTKTTSQKVYLGEIFTFNKQFDQAVVVLNDVLRAEPTNIIAKNNLSYITKSREYANAQVKSARYFRIRNSMFFEREYLNKALKSDPYNLDANILMGRLNQRQKKYAQAYNCYSIVVAKAKDSKTLEKYTKRLNKMKAKLGKSVSSTPASSSNIKPVNVKSQKTKTKVKNTNTKVDYSPKDVR